MKYSERNPNFSRETIDVALIVAKPLKISTELLVHRASRHRTLEQNGKFPPKTWPPIPQGRIAENTLYAFAS